jgi:hypothetical protein
MTDLLDKFYLKTGELSDNALSCGDMESVWFDSIHLTMWKEHQHYHVEACDHKGEGILFWEVFDLLTPARKRFRQAAQELGEKHELQNQS